ncbi:hypothetical protein ACWHAR_21840 [Bacillus sp. LR--39]
MAAHLTEHGRITVKHAEEVIEATDEPVRAVRRKKNSSMVLMAAIAPSPAGTASFMNSPRFLTA